MSAPVSALGSLLSQAVSQATGERFQTHDLDPLAGGCIHTAVGVAGETAQGPRRYFAKVNDAKHDALFETEADGLNALGQAGRLRVPKVVAQGCDDDRSWLVLEWLELSTLDATSGAHLGAALAAQHRIAQDQFGWGRDNFIGATPQHNGWTDDWTHFWCENRLRPQLYWAARGRLRASLIDSGERLAAECSAFFDGYEPERSLLHGDLWSGNAAGLEDGTSAVFDPAVYVGDRETDLAMTELFGGFPSEFHAAYRDAWPLDEGYGVRRDFYNVYHLLNHANLFGGTYVGQSERAILKLLAEI